MCAEQVTSGQHFINKHLKRAGVRRYLDIPVFVEIVDAGDAAAVPVGVVNMADVPSAVAGVTGDHRLQTRETKSLLAPVKRAEQKLL